MASSSMPLRQHQRADGCGLRRGADLGDRASSDVLDHHQSRRTVLAGGEKCIAAVGLRVVEHSDARMRDGRGQRQRQGGAVEFERQRRLVEGAVMDDLVTIDVEQRILLRGVQRPLQLPDKRIQRRDDAGLGNRVDPQPVRVLDARRAVVGSSGIGEQATATGRRRVPPVERQPPVRRPPRTPTGCRRAQGN